MTTVVQYVTAMRRTQDQIGAQFGADLRRIPQETRILDVTVLGLIAVVAKTMEDKGLVAAADFQATLNAALTEVFPPEPPAPVT